MEYQPNPARWGTPLPKGTRYKYKPGATATLVSAVWDRGIMHIEAANTPTGSYTLCGDTIPWRMLEMASPFRVHGVVSHCFNTCSECTTTFNFLLYDPLGDPLSDESLAAAVDNAMNRIAQNIRYTGVVARIAIHNSVRDAGDKLHRMEIELLGFYWSSLRKDAKEDDNLYGWRFVNELNRIDRLQYNGRSPF